MGEARRTDYGILPIRFVEPNVNDKRKELARSRKPKFEKAFKVEDVKQTLLDIREDSVKNLLKYEKLLTSNLKKNFNVSVSSAESGSVAISQISKIIGDIDTVAINRSSTVKEIMLDLPEDTAINFFDSYNEAIKSSIGPDLTGSGLKTGSPLDYWELPESDPIQIWNSFNFEPSLKGYYKSDSPFITGNYAALMGINCISTDGNLFLLQHLQNITNVLANSEVAIFIVGLEKLVKSLEQAEFQTRCAGLFGYETILLDLFAQEDLLSKPVAGKIKRKTRNKKRKTREGKRQKPFIESGLPEEVHLIILDNGRKELMRTEFSDILKCIGCKACAKLCLRTRWKGSFNTYNARDLIMTAFVHGIEFSRDNGLFDCTLCRNCQDICPVDIPLQEYILMLRNVCEKEGIVPTVHEQIYQNIHSFNTPYGKK